MNVGPRTIVFVSYPDNMTQCFLHVDRPVSGNETNYALRTHTTRSGFGMQLLCYTESQCVTTVICECWRAGENKELGKVKISAAGACLYDDKDH